MDVCHLEPAAAESDPSLSLGKRQRRECPAKSRLKVSRGIQRSVRLIIGLAYPGGIGAVGLEPPSALPPALELLPALVQVTLKVSELLQLSPGL